MHAVTVHTGGDVRVAFLQQPAVNTVAVFPKIVPWHCPQVMEMRERGSSGVST